MTELAQACIEYRAKHDLTQTEFAKRCRLERTVISKAETGKPISKMTEIKIRLTIEEEEGS